MTLKKSSYLNHLWICWGLVLVMALAGCNSGTAPKTKPEGEATLSPQALEHFRQGHHFLAEHKLDEALKEFQEATRLAPDSAVATFWLGKVYFYRKDKEKAEQLFHKVLKLEPKNYHALTMLGEIYSQDKSKVDEAQGYLQQALAESPDNLETHFNLGRVFALKGDREKALMEFRYIFAQEADFALYHFELGRIMEAWGRKEDALKSYQRAVTLNPRFELASQAIKRLEAAPQGAATAPAATPPGTQPAGAPRGTQEKKPAK